MPKYLQLEEMSIVERSEIASREGSVSLRLMAPVETRKDKMALAAIYQSNPEDALFFIAEKGTKKEVWNMLKTMHLGTGRVKNAKV